MTILEKLKMLAVDAYGKKIDGPTADSPRWSNAEPWPVKVMERILKDLGKGEDGRIRWADHTIVEKGKDNKPYYVCHPYCLGSVEMKELSRLGELGYEVGVNGNSSYYVGQTVRVQIELPPEPEKNWLYRMYDCDNRLLYIGISKTFISRWKQHKGNKHWFDQIRTFKIEEFPTREAVLIAERDAIKNEHPLYNQVHNQQTVQAAARERS